MSAYNEEQNLPYKLEILKRIPYPKAKLEYIIVNDGSTDKTGDILSEFAVSTDNVKLITLRKRGGKVNALNKALDLCKGEFVIFTDADIYFNPEVIPELIKRITGDPSLGAVSGISIPTGKKSSLSYRVERIFRNFYNAIRMLETRLGRVLICESGLSIFRRQLLDKIPVNIVCDDLYRTLNAIKKGYKTAYYPRVKFQEICPRSLSSSIKQKLRRSRNQQKVLLMHISNFMFKRKYGVFGFIIFPLALFIDFVSPVLVALCLSSYILLLFLNLDNSLLLATILLLIITIIFSYIALIILDALSYSIRPDKHRILDAIILPIGFLSYQLCLFVSLLTLFKKTQPIYRGPRD